jgi:molecular chaperone DnaJ
MVTIPAGVDDGKRVAIPRQGDAGPGNGPPGDLYVFIRVLPHEYFERQNADLYCAVPVSITQAALGADLHVQTIDGKTIKVKIPAGVQNGKLLRIRDEGVPVSGGTSFGSRRGDMYIKLMVRVPAKLSKRGRELLEEFARAEGDDDSPAPVALAEM